MADIDAVLRELGEALGRQARQIAELKEQIEKLNTDRPDYRALMSLREDIDAIRALFGRGTLTALDDLESTRTGQSRAWEENRALVAQNAELQQELDEFKLRDLTAKLAGGKALTALKEESR